MKSKKTRNGRWPFVDYPEREGLATGGSGLVSSLSLIREEKENKYSEVKKAGNAFKSSLRFLLYWKDKRKGGGSGICVGEMLCPLVPTAHPYTPRGDWKEKPERERGGGLVFVCGKKNEKKDRRKKCPSTITIHD